jgi:glutamyl-tRNA synthetase
MVRVRIAPSPTGIPHIGNTRTALYNYLFAKNKGGEFVLRIEDTDRVRLVPGAEKAIYEILEWLGIKWDGDVYKQSEHLDQYQKYADILIKKGLAYLDDGAIRFKMSKTGETVWTDLVGNKRIVFKNETQEDFVIIKSDKFPTYNFANVVDDHLMNITDVIRGEEFISSTPKHIALYEAFGWSHPNFAHLPIVLGPDRSKLSKRHGAKSVLDYRNEGYLKEAILNFMVLLGWNPGGDKEFMSLSEMVKLFELKDINSASPIFDIKKLEWMNGEYVRKMDNKTLKILLLEFYKQDKEIIDYFRTDPKALELILNLAKTRMKTLREFKDLVIPKVPELSDDEKNVAKTMFKKLSEIKVWNKEEILSAMREVLNIHKAKGNILYKIMTGFEKGLPLPESLEILGKEKASERISKNLK